MRTFLRILLSATLLALAVPVYGEEDKPETIEILTVGAITYTNVQILQRTKSDLFIKYAGGAVNVKIKDLDKSTQLQLGYSLPDPAAVAAAQESRSSLPEIEVDPRYREIAEQVIWESQEFLRTVDHRVLYAAGGGWCALYLFFCWCCSLIARKAGQEMTGLCWLPLFKQVPLLRAAGMSPWWMITNLLPPVFVITYIVWCFKISKARGKGPMTGCLLLLPVINIFAFLYLAFADRLQRDDDYGDSGRVLSFQQGPRRAA